MTRNTPSVSVILVNFHSADLIRRAVASVRTWEKGTAPEIILVDNSPDDPGLGGLAQDFPDLRVISNPANLGFARACNIGVAAAEGEFILLLNSDAFLVAEILPDCMDSMRWHGKGILTCVLLNLDGSVQPHACDFPRLSRWLLESFTTTGFWSRSDARRFSGIAPRGTRMDWVTGAFLFTSRAFYLEMEGMSEDFFMYGEDLDFCLRASLRGVSCYCLPNRSVVHMGGGTLDHSDALCLALVDWSRIHVVRLREGRFKAGLARLVFAWRSFARMAAFALLHLVTGNPSHRSRAGLHLRGLGYLGGILETPASIPPRRFREANPESSPVSGLADYY